MTLHFYILHACKATLMMLPAQAGALPSCTFIASCVLTLGKHPLKQLLPGVGNSSVVFSVYVLACQINLHLHRLAV